MPVKYAFEILNIAFLPYRNLSWLKTVSFAYFVGCTQIEDSSLLIEMLYKYPFTIYQLVFG